MARYVFIDGSKATDSVDAQTAGQELDRIMAERHSLTPSTVVDESRPEEAPLHPVFEWQDPIAAEKYREYQATKLIRRVRVVCEAPPEVNPVEIKDLAINAESESDEVTEDFDPIGFAMGELLGRILEDQRKAEELKRRAASRYDRRRVAAADVAIRDLKEAEQRLLDARESLANARRNGGEVCRLSSVSAV